MRASMMAVPVVIVLITGCGGAREPRSYVLDQAPPELAAPAAVADSAVRELQQRLGSRLFEEMGRGGPVAAIEVCRTEAQTITQAVAAERGVTLGRTSHRVRNPRNAARDWVGPYVTRSEGMKAADVSPVVVDLGNRVGLLRPIAVAGPCLQCHGAPDALGPGLAAVLAEAYPEDGAVGFAEGDLRGFFWAEAPKR